MNSTFVLRSLSIVAALALVVGVTRVIAAPPGSVYTPGETLAPSCAPGSENCTVTAPMAAVTPGTSGNVLTSNGSAWTSVAPAGSSEMLAGQVVNESLVNASAGVSVSKNGTGIYVLTVTGANVVIGTATPKVGSACTKMEVTMFNGGVVQVRCYGGLTNSLLDGDFQFIAQVLSH